MEKINQERIHFFTIQFQLNIAEIDKHDKKDAEYQYKLSNNDQESYFIYPSNNSDTNEYKTIETWEYIKVNDDKIDRIKPKINDDINSTKPTLLQFITKTKNDDSENDFELQFRIKYPNRTDPLEFEPLVNDQKIIPNTSYALFPKKDGRQSNSKLYVILNIQKSFNISLYPLYKGIVIDEKDASDSIDPKHYEIYFKNQNQEYILYRSEIRDKKYRWSPFYFRYLNLENPQIFIRFFYSGKEPITQIKAPSVTEYIDFSCKSNSYKDFFKYKTKSTPIDDYLLNRCTNKDEKYFFIFPFIKKSPIDIQKVQAVEKIDAKDYYLFIEDDSYRNSYKTFSKLAEIFMSKIGFHKTNFNDDYDFPENDIYYKLITTVKSIMEKAPKYCNHHFHNELITDADYNSYIENLEAQKKTHKKANLMEPLTQKNRTSSRVSINPKNVSKFRSASSSENAPRKVFLNYQVLFIYDYESENGSNYDFTNLSKELGILLSLYPNENQTKIDEENENDIFSIAGEQIENINKGIYNLSKNYTQFIKKKDEKKGKHKKNIKELYSGFPLLIVTLIQNGNIKSKFRFWKKICEQYPFIKLICVKSSYNNQYNDQIILNYLSELKCIYDIFVKWTSQINFTFPIQMKIDPTSHNSLSLTSKMIYSQKYEFIRRQLLESLSFDFNEWLNYKGHYSALNFFSWKNIEMVLALRDKEFNPIKDIISEKIEPKKDGKALTGKEWNDLKQRAYATILAAATSILYHHRGGDPYSEPCFIFALNWIKNQGLVDNKGSLLDESGLEHIILNLNQKIKPPSKSDRKSKSKAKQKSKARKIVSPF